VAAPLAALLAQGLALGFSASASPGPFQALLLERSARLGPRRALHLALVPLVSDPPVVVACLFALAGLPGGLLRLLSLAGGALLLFLGGATLRGLWRERASSAVPGAPARSPDQAPAQGAAQGGFWRAVLVNLLNPNAWLFWSLVGGPILAGTLRAAPLQPLAFLGSFYLSLTATNAFTVLVFGAVGRLGPRAARLLGGLSAVAFLLLGLAQLWRGLG
jgi:threonine/homoserine/homoserine lactone efflux protein